MTYEECAKAVYILQSNYPNFFTKQSADQAEVMVLSWEACFADYSFEIIQTAILKLLLTKKDYPPTIADINAEICKMIKPNLTVVSGEEAWGTAYSLMSKYGSVHNMFPEDAEKLNAEIGKDKALESAIRAVGGLRAISLCELGGLNTLRAQFIKIYNAYASRATENALLPESIKIRIAEETKIYLPVESTTPNLPTVDDVKNPDKPVCMPEGVIDIMKNIVMRRDVG